MTAAQSALDAVRAARKTAIGKSHLPSQCCDCEWCSLRELLDAALPVIEAAIEDAERDDALVVNFAALRSRAERAEAALRDACEVWILYAYAPAASVKARADWAGRNCVAINAAYPRAALLEGGAP